MIPNTLFAARIVLALAFLLIGMVRSRADSIVYDNTETSGGWYRTTNEVGDDVILSGSESERYLTQIDFKYFLAEGASGDETARLRLYRNDGPNGVPGTLLFLSGGIPVVSGLNSATVSIPAILVPNELTWTIQFSGVTGAETSGLWLYTPPSVGSSSTNFWEKTGATWTRYYWADGTPGRFGCRLRAGTGAGSPVIVTQPRSQTVRPGGNAVLAASATGANPLSYQWYWFGMVDDFDEGATTLNLVITDAADYDAGPYALEVSNGQGSALSLTATLSVLPVPWQSLDIGDVGEPGWAEFASEVYTVRGSGGGIWGRYDAFQFVHQPLEGQGSIIVQITRLDDTDPMAKVGVMIREKLTAGSRHALMALTPESGSLFQYRADPAELSTATPTGDGIQAPCWVKLERVGSTFTGYRSANGADWIPVGAASIPMANSVYCGLAVCSRVKEEWNEGVFEKVQVNTGSAPGTAAPVFAVQPVSQTVGLGSTVVFTVVVTNAPVLTYQWQCNGISLTDGGGITGATTATLTIANVLPSHAGNYSIVAANAAGATTSTHAQLAVLPPAACQITAFRVDPSPRLEAVFPSHQYAWLEWTPSLAAPAWKAIPETTVEPNLASLDPVATAVWTNLPTSLNGLFLRVKTAPDGLVTNANEVMTYAAQGQTYDVPAQPNGIIQDEVTGFGFQFPQGGSGQLTITKILSGPGLEPHQVAFRASYSGLEPINLVIPSANPVFARLLIFTEGRYVETLGEIPADTRGWFAIPELENSGTTVTFPLFRPGSTALARMVEPGGMEPPAVSDFTVDLNRPPVHTLPPDLQAAYDKFEKGKNDLIAKFLGLYSGTEQARLRQLLTNHTTRPFLLVQRDRETPCYSPWLLHPWLKIITHTIYLSTNTPLSSLHHEMGHYFHHILVGDTVFLGLKTRGTIFTGHALGDTGAASTLIEEPAYFTQYFATYTKVDTSGDWLRGQLGNRAPTANYPDLEGFTCHMLTQLIRRADTTTPFIAFDADDSPIPVPVISGTTDELFLQCYGLIADANKFQSVYTVRNSIASFLAGQSDKLPALLQAIGWNYKIQCRFVDKSGQPVAGLSAQALSVTGGQEYLLPAGHPPGNNNASITGPDGNYVLDFCFGGNATLLRVTKGTRHLDLGGKINAEWTQAANTGLNLGDIEVEFLNINPAQAAPEETVTIEGSGFGSSSQGGSVAFSGIPATVVSWTDTQIKVKVPLAAPGNSQVQVVAGGVTSDEVPFRVILRLDLTGKSDRVVDCTTESGETPQITTFTVWVTSPFQGPLVYQWDDGLPRSETGNAITLDTSRCPYESIGCSVCGLLGITVTVRVQDSLERQGTAFINWGGAF